MSKVKKISNKKVIDTKTINHYSSLSEISQNATFANARRPSPDKKERTSESPFPNKLIKIRSNSILKDPLLNQSSGLVSPPLNSKFGMNVKSKFNLSNSFYSKVKEANVNENKKYIKKKINVKTKSVDIDNDIIEKKNRRYLFKTSRKWHLK